MIITIFMLGVVNPLSLFGSYALEMPGMMGSRTASFCTAGYTDDT